MEFIHQNPGAETVNVMFVIKVVMIVFLWDDLFKLSAFFARDMSRDKNL
jgi:UDP-N-acetylmuramyl pentapeptide phosphotransferase/UDP-N-acetylglucosamine-1-phosphate transferase